VLAVVEQRRADGAQILTRAQSLRDEALALKAEYEARLAQAAEDRDRAMAKLDGEIAAERAQRLAVVEAELDAERERRRALEARERSERDAERERQALALAARFATRLLDRVASPELEDRLVEMAQAELQATKPDQRAALRAALGSPGARIEVVTAYSIGPTRRAALTAALSALAERTLTPEFSADPMLKAGLSITAGPWVLMANLRDELEFFCSSLDHAD
jgi:F-type H+-transporting ATPase subunit b